MKNKEARVAVCLSGQARGIPSNDSVKKNIIEPLNADVFFHFWEGLGSGQAVQFYNPVKYVIEPQKQFPDLVSEEEIRKLNHPEPEKAFDLTFKTASMYYSIKEAMKLRREYEQGHGFVYDCVFRVRSDQVLRRPVDLEKDYKEDGVVHLLFRGKKNWPGCVDDCFAYGSADIMDCYAECFDTLYNIKRENNWRHNPVFVGESCLSWHMVHNGYDARDTDLINDREFKKK